MNTLVAIAALFGLLCLGLFAWRRSDTLRDRRTWQTLAEAAAPPGRHFDEDMVSALPEPARRYFLYTIAPGTPLFGASEIEMQGEIGLGDREKPRYAPMAARQFLAPPHGLLWEMKSGAISGSDGATPDTSWTRFWLFNILPVVRVGGDADHFRSAFGRVAAEAVFWAPAALLLHPQVRWQQTGENTFRAIIARASLEQAVDVTVAGNGEPEQVIIQRWSNANPDKSYRLQPFGGFLCEFREFQGYRLPTRVEGGNFIGTDDYFPFYRARVTAIRFSGYD